MVDPFYDATCMKMKSFMKNCITKCQYILKLCEVYTSCKNRCTPKDDPAPQMDCAGEKRSFQCFFAVEDNALTLMRFADVLATSTALFKLDLIITTLELEYRNLHKGI